MDFSLSKLDLSQVSTVSHSGTLVLFPPGKKRRHKIVVGDDAGRVTCFEMRKAEAQTVFEYASEESAAIRCLAMNYNAGTRDRVFASQDQRVIGLNKKGRQAFLLDAPSTEPINSIAVHDVMLYTGCEFIYNLYDNGRDAGYYMCHDRINAMAIQRMDPEAPAAECALACQDQCVRILRRAELLQEIPMEAPVTAIRGYHPDDKPPPLDQSPKRLLYGTAAGSFGLLECDRDGSARPASVWPAGGMTGGQGPTSGQVSRAGVVDMLAADLTQDGACDVVLTRTDGSLEVYSLNAEEGEHAPSLLYHTNAGERVQGIQCGRVNNADFDEVLALTLSGRVASFTTEPVEDDTHAAALRRAARKGEQQQGKPGAAGDGSEIEQLRGQARVKALRKELATLRDRVVKEEEKFAKVSGASSTATHGPGSFSDGPVVTAQKFDVQLNATLEPGAGAYLLDMEIPLPIDMVTMHADVHIEVLDTGSSQASLSQSPVQEGSGKAFLMTARFQEPSNRLQLRFRTNEGEAGQLVFGVVPRASNHMATTAQVVKHEVKALSLHHRVHTLPSRNAPAGTSSAHRQQDAHGDVPGSMFGTDRSPETGADPVGRGPGGEPTWNELHVEGKFSMSMMHEWLASALPGVPPRVQEDSYEMFFVSAFTGSELWVRYSQGEATVCSTSISTIAILRDVVTQKAKELRIELHDRVSADKHTIVSMLEGIDPKLQYQMSLARKAQVIDAIKELAMQQDGAPWLSQDYREILEGADHIREEMKHRPRALQYISGVLTDLYVDWHKANGRDMRGRIPDLQAFVSEVDYNLQGLVDFFLATAT